MKWNLLKTRKGRLGLLIATVVLIAGLTVSGTLAYLAHSFEPEVNEFQPVAAYCEIQETFENNEKSGIKVSIPATNGGTACMDAYVRVTLVCNWQDADGKVVAKFTELPVLPTSLGEGWTLGSDGYYYYNEIVKAGETTSELFTEEIAGYKSSEGYTLSVTVVAEAIQANAAVSAWGPVTAEKDGTLSVTQ